jgi:hypothetical protein
MSTLALVKESGTLILGTDSRFMKLDFSGPASDAEQKIHEVAPGAFIATSGRKRACDFQTQKARELATQLGTSDIRVIAAVLARESFHMLTALVEDMGALQHIEPGIADAVAGRALLHGCILAGRTADGQLGFVSHAYSFQAGQVICASEEYFGDARKIVFSTPVPVNGSTFAFIQDPALWTDPAEAVVRRILREARESTVVSGGPDQVVQLNSDGSYRWMSPPPTPAVPLAGDMLAATINALVSLNSPTVNGGTITGATLTLTANGVTTQINNTTPGGPFNAGAGLYMKRTSDNAFSALTPVEMAIVHPSGVGYSILARSLSGFQDYGYLRLQQHGTSGSALLEATGLLTLIASGGTQGSLSATRLTLGGNIVVQGRQIGPGNTTDTTDVAVRFNNLLTALRAHGLIT